MNILFIVIISFLISFTWLHYFKKIDLFEQEKVWHIVATFLLGTVIPFSIYIIHEYIYYPLGISDSPEPFNSFLFYVFGVGLLEEIIKCIPVLIVIFVFKKAINEPLDYVKYICVSALGFAFGENIEYAINYGGHVLLPRAILAVPAHMFFSSIFIYGIIEFRYAAKKWETVLVFMFLAALTHGLYDFLIVFKVPIFGSIINIAFFMVTISLFVNILNNCLNISPFYSPKKVIDQEEIRRYLIRFYFLITLSILVFTTISEGFKIAFKSYVWLMFWESIILYVLIVRLSRFSIIPNQKNKLRVKFPFYISKNPSQKDFRTLFGLLTIRGESYNEAKISMLYEEEIRVIPLSKKNSYLNTIYTGIIEKKCYENNTIYFLLKIYLNTHKTEYKHFILIPKKEGLSFNADGHPIVGLNGIGDANKLYFHEWVVIKKSNL